LESILEILNRLKIRAPETISSILPSSSASLLGLTYCQL
jgi:hypothetical protein